MEYSVACFQIHKDTSVTQQFPTVQEFRASLRQSKMAPTNKKAKTHTKKQAKADISDEDDDDLYGNDDTMDIDPELDEDLYGDGNEEKDAFILEEMQGSGINTMDVDDQKERTIPEQYWLFVVGTDGKLTVILAHSDLSISRNQGSICFLQSAYWP
jgi:hypothetical protein